MKKLLSVLAIVTMIVSISVMAAAEDKLTFGFSTNVAATFWTHARAGTIEAQEQYGVDVDFYMPPTGSPEEQKRWLETMIAKGIDGIAISILAPEDMTPLLNEIAAEVPLVMTDSDAPNSTRLAYIGMSNYAAGRMAGNAIKEQLPDGGKFAIFVGRLDAQNAIERRQGIIDELMDKPYAEQYPGEMSPAEPNIQAGKWLILDTRTDNVDASRAKANVEDMFVRNPDIDLMIGLWSYSTPAIISALRDAEQLGEIIILAFDEDETVLEGIKDGYVAGTIVQNPYEYGRKSIEVLYKLVKGEDAGIPENMLIDVPARYIVLDPSATSLKPVVGVDDFWEIVKKQLEVGGAAEQK